MRLCLQAEPLYLPALYIVIAFNIISINSISLLDDSLLKHDLIVLSKLAGAAPFENAVYNLRNVSRLNCSLSPLSSS